MTPAEQSGLGRAFCPLCGADSRLIPGEGWECAKGCSLQVDRAACHAGFLVLGHGYAPRDLNAHVIAAEVFNWTARALLPPDRADAEVERMQAMREALKR